MTAAWMMYLLLVGTLMALAARCSPGDAHLRAPDAMDLGRRTGGRDRSSPSSRRDRRCTSDSSRPRW